MQPFLFQFPQIALTRDTVVSQLVKIESEAVEAVDAYADCEPDLRIAEELMDVIHAAETALRMLPLSDRELNAVKAGVIAKNEERGYYDAA